MKTYITELQIYDESNDLIATLKSFDDESFTVEWKNDIPMAEHLRYVADLLENEMIYEEIKI